MAENYRESRKQELRERVLDSEDLQQESRSRRGNRRVRYVILVLILLLFILLAAVFNWFLGRELHNVRDGWIAGNSSEIASSQSDYESFVPYADGLLRITRDGAGYVNSSGKIGWNQAFEMTSPYVSVNGDFVAIADQGKTSIYIMNDSGYTGRAETSLPITKIAVSERGVVYALLEDSDASYISVFTKEGNALDITIKSVLEGDGYPLDLAISPDGTELICSFAYLENGVLQNKIIFYNLSEVGQSAGNNRVVGGFTDDFKGHLTGRVRFSGNDSAQAFYDGGIAFFSTKVLTSPELLNNVEISESIRSIAYSGDYVGVITDAEGEGILDPYRLTVYRSNGQKLYERLFSFNYSGFELDQGRALLFRDEELHIIDRNGRLKFSGILNHPISMVKILSDNPLGISLIVGGEGMVENIKLR